MRAAAVVGVFLAGAGCQSYTFEDYVHDVESSDCGWMVRCGQIAASEQTICETSQHQSFDFRVARGLEGVSVAIAAGSLVFDADSARQCLKSHQSATCTASLAQQDDPACWTVLLGRLNEGDVCRIDAECAGGFCDASQSCPGRCRASLGASESCDGAFDHCAAGLACSSDQVCAAPVGAGEDCSKAGCLPGTTCVFDPSSSAPGPICVTPQAADGPCSGESSCQGGLECFSYTPVNGGYAAACQAPGAEGEPCNAFGCAFGLACGPGPTDAGLCQRTLDLGQPCDLAFDACAALDLCSPTRHTCVGFLDAVVGTDCTAQTCTSRFTSGGELVCDPAHHQCIEKLPGGAPCSTAEDLCFTRCDPVTRTCEALDAGCGPQ